jgi:hypothetical protein
MTASDVEVVTLHVGDDFGAAVCGGCCLDFSDGRRKSVPLPPPPFGAARAPTLLAFPCRRVPSTVQSPFRLNFVRLR